MKNKFFHRFLDQPRFKRSSLEAVSRPSWRTLILIFTFSCSSHIGHITVTLFFNNVCLYKASFDMFLAFTDIIILVFDEFFSWGLSTGKEAPVTGNVDSNDFRRRTIQDSRVPATRRRSHCGSKKLKSARNIFTSIWFKCDFTSVSNQPLTFPLASHIQCVLVKLLQA